jgi:hypothetical protein
MSMDGMVLRFRDASMAEGNRLAGSLGNVLRDCDPSVRVERRREQSDTQDFGASLGVILGTAAANAVAKGIAAWLGRNSGVKLEIRRGDKVVLTATHLDSGDVSRIAEALSRNM